MWWTCIHHGKFCGTPPSTAFSIKGRQHQCPDMCAARRETHECVTHAPTAGRILRLKRREWCTCLILLLKPPYCGLLMLNNKLKGCAQFYRTRPAQAWHKQQNWTMFPLLTTGARRHRGRSSGDAQKQPATFRLQQEGRCLDKTRGKKAPSNQRVVIGHAPVQQWVSQGTRGGGCTQEGVESARSGGGMAGNTLNWLGWEADLLSTWRCLMLWITVKSNRPPWDRGLCTGK